MRIHLLTAAAVCTLALSVGCDRRTNADRDNANTTTTTTRNDDNTSTTHITSGSLGNDTYRDGGHVVLNGDRNGNGTMADEQARDMRERADDQADFLRKREDYRHSKQKDLVDLDEKITKLEAKAKTATGKTRADILAALPDIRAKRDIFKRDFEKVGNASATGWDDTKARLDHEWDDVKTSLDKAPSVM